MRNQTAICCQGYLKSIITRPSSGNVFAQFCIAPTTAGKQKKQSENGYELDRAHDVND